MIEKLTIVLGGAVLVYMTFTPHVAGQIGLLSAAIGGAG